MRPPGSVDDTSLDLKCTRCDACIENCAAGILIRGSGGLPAVDFSRGACTFCGRCAAVCAPQVIRPAVAWPLRACVSAACLEPQGIACRVCEGACDAAALRFRPMLGGRAQVIVNDDRCTGCGACVAICPTGAIRISQPQPERTPCPAS